MYYIGLDDTLTIRKISNIKPDGIRYILTTKNDKLFNFLKRININDLKINLPRLVADLRKDRTLEEMFNLIDNNFEHLLLYLDVPSCLRLKLNYILLDIIKLNLNRNKKYIDNSKFIDAYINETYAKCEKVLNHAKNSNELLDNYMTFIFLKFADKSTFLSVKSRYVLHCPGLNKCYDNLINDLFKNYSKNIKIDDNIDICTVATSNLINSSPIISQCNDINKQIYFSSNALNSSYKDWKRYHKLKYIIDCLQQCKSKYTLIVDGSDAIILNNLDNDFIVRFKNINVPFIFNSDNYKFPCYEIEPFDFMYQNNFDRYLNGGVVFGYTDKLLEFYSLAYNLMMSQSNKINSEQFYLRLALTQYKNGLYCIDYSQELFLKCSLKNNFKYKIVNNDIYLFDYRSYLNWIPYDGIDDNGINYLLI